MDRLIGVEKEDADVADVAVVSGELGMQSMWIKSE